MSFYNTISKKGVSRDDASGLLKAAVEEVSRVGRIWIQVDALKALSKFGTKNLEKQLCNRLKGKTILRIDADTVANPKHPAKGWESRESTQWSANMT